MRSVATLTGASRLPLVSLQLVLVTLAEAIIGVLTGRFRQVGASLDGAAGNGAAHARLLRPSAVAGQAARGARL